MITETKVNCYACEENIPIGSKVAGRRFEWGWAFLCLDCSRKCGNTLTDNPQKGLRAIFLYRQNLYMYLDADDIVLVSRLLDMDMIDLMTEDTK